MATYPMVSLDAFAKLVPGCLVARLDDHDRFSFLVLVYVTDVIDGVRSPTSRDCTVMRLGGCVIEHVTLCACDAGERWRVMSAHGG